MTEAYGIRKARQGAEKHPGGSERREGAGAGGTGRANSAERARLIGDRESGGGRQMRRGASFGGPLRNGHQLGQTFVADFSYLTAGCGAYNANPISGRYRATAAHSFCSFVTDAYVSREVSDGRPEINDIGVRHAPKGTYHTLKVKRDRYDLYL